jgi:hypothetical protein
MVAPRQVPMEDNYNQGMVETTGQSSSRYGMYILKQGINGVVKKPSWNGTLTVFRPFPCLDYNDPNNKFEPFRTDPGGRNAYGRWIRKYDCAWSVGAGVNKVTMLLSDPSISNAYDPSNTPLGVLYRAVESACKNRHHMTAEWQHLREGGAGRGRPLAAPTHLYLMQGVVMVIDDKPMYGHNKSPIGWAQGKETCVLALSKGLGEALVGQLNQTVDGFQGDPSDFEHRYVNGDPVSVDFGRYMYFFQKGHDPRNKFGSQPQQMQQHWDTQSEGGAVGNVSAGGFQDKGYDLYLDKFLNGMPATLNLPHQVQRVREKWLFWKESLWFPTLQEQAAKLWEVFPKSACVYAWEGFNRSWITEDMWKEYRNTVSASVPGNVPGAADAAVMPGIDDWTFGMQQQQQQAGQPGQVGPMPDPGGQYPWSGQSGQSPFQDVPMEDPALAAAPTQHVASAPTQHAIVQPPATGIDPFAVSVPASAVPVQPQLPLQPLPAQQPQQQSQQPPAPAQQPQPISQASPQGSAAIARLAAARHRGQPQAPQPPTGNP